MLLVVLTGNDNYFIVNLVEEMLAPKTTLRYTFYSLLYFCCLVLYVMQN